MSGLRRMLARLKGLGTARRDEARLREEMAEHLALLAAENERAGLPRDEARRQAAVKFGGVEAAKEAWREERRPARLEATGRDLLRAARRLRAAPGFTAVVVLTLALGIGATTALFSVMDAVMWRSLPVPHANRLVLLRWQARRPPQTSNYYYFPCPGASGNGPRNPSSCTFSGPMFRAIRRRLRGTARAFAFFPLFRVVVAAPAGATVSGGYFVSGGLFPALGINPAAGRLLGPGDDAPGAPPAVVVSYGYWQREWGGSRRAIGQVVTVNGVAATVVGVTPAGFRGLGPGDRAGVWLPLRMVQQLNPRFPGLNDRGALFLEIGAALNHAAARGAAQARANAAFRSAALAAHVFQRRDGARVALLPAARGLNTAAALMFAPPLEILMAVVALLLLIACANVAGLLLARAPGRQKEIAICLALGAGRGRIARQLFAESLWLGAGGGLLGLGFAVWGARALAGLLTAGSGGTFPLAVSPNPAVLAFAAGVALFCAALSGLIPAWRASAVAPAPALKLAPGHAARRRRFGLGAGQALVIGQAALSVLVLAGAGLLVRTLGNLDRVRLGFNPRHLLVVNVDVSTTRLKGHALAAFDEQIRRRLAAIPGVTAAADAQMPLLSGGYMDGQFIRPAHPRAGAVTTPFLGVGPGFFATMGIPLLAGREFAAADVAAKRKLAIVNRRFAERAFGSADPIGQEIQGNGAIWRIVGIAANARYGVLQGRFQPVVYMLAPGEVFNLRCAAAPGAVMPAVRRVIRGASRAVAIADMTTERQQIAQFLWQQRLLARLSSLFAALALLLAALGLYGLLAFEVARSSRETGIRIALGAKPGAILRRTVARGLELALAGGAAGLAAAAVLTRLLQAHLFGVSVLDPVSYAAALALLLLVAAAACYLPARRAAALDPAQVIHEE
jgi:predicted permease